MFNGCHEFMFHYLMEVCDTGELLYVTDDNDYLRDFTRHPEMASRDQKSVSIILQEFLVTRGFGYNPNEGLTLIEKGKLVLQAAKKMHQDSLNFQEMTRDQILNLQAQTSPNPGENATLNFKVAGKMRVLNFCNILV